MLLFNNKKISFGTYAPHSDNYALLGILCALMGPCIIFYCFIGNFILGIIVVLILALCLTQATRFQVFRAREDLPKQDNILITICFATAIVLTTLGGEGRILPATPDWLIRDAVLHDLVVNHWPFVERFNSQDWVIRAPLGMYLLPALVGKCLGLYSAYLALWGQNTIILFFILYIFSKGDTLANSLVVLLVFCFFSGMDIVGALFLAYLRVLFSHAPLYIPADIGWWNGVLQYSSTITQILWVPNHGLGAWLPTTLLLMWDRGKLRISIFFAGCAFSMFWCPSSNDLRQFEF